MSKRLFHARFKRSPIDEPVVNLTPLIDVVFVILIMFIVVAPLLELDQVALADAPNVSKDTVFSVQETSKIAIHVRQDNTVRINNQAIPLERLVDLLIELKERHPNAKPQLFHDKKAYFGTYQAVKNGIEAAGFKQMDVILNPA